MWDRMEAFPIGFMSLQRFIRDTEIVELRAGVGQGGIRRPRLTTETYGGDLREFANSDISPTDIKGTLVGSDTMDLKSDEPRVVGLRIGDVFDQLAIDPGLDPFAFSSDVVLVPIVIFQDGVDRLGRGDPIASGGLSVDIP